MTNKDLPLELVPPAGYFGTGKRGLRCMENYLQIAALLYQGSSRKEVLEKVKRSEEYADRYIKIYKSLGGKVVKQLDKLAGKETGPNADRHLCKKCKYQSGNRPGGKGCDYILETGSRRGCKVENCDKFERRTKSKQKMYTISDDSKKLP